ncbi:ATP-binding protein [Rhodococcoides yunnanense]|uniref:ATP-binding protein n=1 Tax=Rhodococcoides yunnanense TaxID=278209 RepID=UPI000932F0C7|nr:ATP-binding protein [Rhodococcus yunnanensis]
MVEIGTDPPSTSRTARTWSLSAWPVRAKVAAVVVMPLILAVAFGALRVQSELSLAAELSAAADNSRIIAPIVAFDRAVGDLAVTGVIPENDDFDEIVETLREGLGTDGSRQPSEAVAIFDQAISGAETLHERLETGTVAPFERAGIAGAVTQSLEAVFAEKVDVEDSQLRSFTNIVVWALAGARAAQSQQLLGALPGAEVTDQVNGVAGSERSILSVLGTDISADSTELDPLLAELDTRLGMYASTARGGPTNVFLSAAKSAELYNDLADRYAGELADALNSQALDARSVALRDTAFVLGSVLAALVLALIVARSLVQPIRRLRLGALDVAQHALPAEIERIRSGGHTPEIVPISVHTNEEIGQLARAVDAIHEEALQLAGEQARLRVQVGNMFETLSRRSRSLVDQQLALIEELERDEDDPRRLDSLFRLDHLATRMRRNGANLMVLAGTPSRRVQGDQPVALDAVMSAAVSEVEDYRRVLMLDVPDAALSSSSAADIVHLVAELIDNALRYSPPDSAVAVTAARAVEGGVLLEVADRGLGMPAADIDETNERLSVGGEVTPETARRMGLFVVGRLAQRHGVTVRLRATQVHGGASGVTVSVHIPVGLVVTSFPTAESVRANRRDIPPVPKAPQPPRNGSIAAIEVPSAETATERTGPVSLIALNGLAGGEHHDLTSARLPRRRPGASGVDDHIASSTGRNGDTPKPDSPPPGRRTNGSPSDTSSFFGARPAVQASKAASSPEVPPPPPDPLAPPPQAMPIYQRMVSEWLVDPATGQGHSRPWSSPADVGWAAAESATDAPVRTRTESGLPVRKPGARLVPGAADISRDAAHRRDDRPAAVSTRNPEAVREKLTSHFTGVRTGRAEDVTGRHRTEEDE